MNPIRNKKRLVLVISVILVSGFLITSLLSHHIARSSMHEQIVSHSLPLTSDNIYSEIQRDLIQPVLISSLMARNTFLIDWMLDGERDVSQITKYLSEIKEKYGTCTCFLVSESTRNYYYFDGVLKKVKPNAERDEWYFRFRQMETDYETNVDPDMANKDAITIFINYRIHDYDGNYLGATGVGLQVRSLIDLMKYYSEKYKRNVYITDEKGRVMLHSHQIAERFENISDIPGMSSRKGPILADPRGEFKYERDGKLVFLNSRYVEELGWYLLVEQTEGETTRGIHNALFVNFAVCGIITLVILIITILAINVYEGVNLAQKSEILEQQERLVRNNKKLEAANNERKQLLHILCHDLSNPFNSLLSSIIMLETDPKMIQNLLPELENSLRNGIGVIDMVIKMGALDEGKLHLDVASTPLEEIVEESSVMLKSKLAAKNITLKVEIEGPLTISVDMVSFVNSVLNNLLTNAIKFSEKNGEILLKAVPVEGNRVKLSIIDDGVGMPESILKSLFDLQANTTRPGTDGEEGAGFGMPLVRKFVNAFGGRITVRSKDVKDHPEGHGTEVEIVLNQ